MTTNLTKAIVLCKRASDLTPAQFRDWFVGPHAESAVRLGGEHMERYTFSFVSAPGPRSAWDDDEPPFDVVSEMWFKDRAALDAAYRELQGGGETSDVIRHTSQRIAVVTEEYVVAEHGAGPRA